MVRLLLNILLWAVTAAVAAVTLLPLTGSTEWWIRMWDFPRLHIFAVALAAALAAALSWRRPAAVPAAILAAAAAIQAHKIYPFTPFAAPELAISQPEGGRAVSLMAANVLMENRQYQRLTGLIEEQRPDVLLLMETDDGWAQALDPILADYATVLRHPLSNYYGMIFATRLPAGAAEIIFLADDETPAILAELEDAAGRRFHFLGLHPRPPVPGNDTRERDAQIRRAAQLARRSGLPAVVMGDFNDVAWSWTAERYKHHGGFLDPRVGRGMMPSFDANHPILRFPIDQIYLTEGIELAAFGRGPHIGSDHFPMQATVTISGGPPQGD